MGGAKEVEDQREGAHAPLVPLPLPPPAAPRKKIDGDN